MAQIQATETQIISGTEIMIGVDHTRQIDVSIPRFASRPDITISIYSDDNMPPAIGSDENANPGTMFAPWAVEYRPEDGVDARTGSWYRPQTLKTVWRLRYGLCVVTSLWVKSQ
jgi:hypothetical protein